MSNYHLPMSKLYLDTIPGIILSNEKDQPYLDLASEMKESVNNRYFNHFVIETETFKESLVGFVDELESKLGKLHKTPNNIIYKTLFESKVHLPFKYITFELTKPLYLEDKTLGKHTFLAMMLVEKTPEKFHFVMICYNGSLEEYSTSLDTSKIFAHSLCSNSNYDFCSYEVLLGFLKAISSKDIRKGKSNYKQKVYDQEGNKIIKRTVFISNKKYIPETELRSNSTINWSHQWEVMGHWRRVKRLGKDRAGDYCVNGFTWVDNFIKGEGNLIKKPRIVWQ